jgi:hypothetical protein
LEGRGALFGQEKRRQILCFARNDNQRTTARAKNNGKGKNNGNGNGKDRGPSLRSRMTTKNEQQQGQQQQQGQLQRQMRGFFPFASLEGQNDNKFRRTEKSEEQ